MSSPNAAKNQKSAGFSERAPAVLICCFIAAAVLLVFWPAARHDFVAWDDDINVYENPLLNPAGFKNIALFWKAPYLRLYIPLTYTIWSAVAMWARRSAPYPAPLMPQPFHALNLLIHMLNGVMAFVLLRKILQTALAATQSQLPGSERKESAEARLVAVKWAAALGAAFFVFHPIQVEPVAWVSGFRDVLSALGALCALHQYLESVTSSDKKKAALHYAAATAAFTAALLSKPSVVIIPLLAGIIDYAILERPLRRIISSLWFWFLLAISCVLLTQSSQGATHIRAMMPLWARPLIAGDTLAFYLYKTVWPFSLSIDYGRPPDLVMSKGWIYYTWLVPALLAFGISRIPGGKAWLACAGLFAGAALPVLGFVPFLHQDLSTAADRYLYLSLLGPSLALAWYLAGPQVKKWDESSAPAWTWSAAAVLVIFLAALSFLQIRVWSNTGTLFGHVVAVNPDSGVAHLNLGNYLAAHGETEKARFHFFETLRLRPGDGLAHNNLGGLLAREGKLDEAMEHFKAVTKEGTPDNNVDAHYSLGVILASRGKTEEATRHYVEALRININSDKVHDALAALLARQGRNSEALREYQWALQIRPGFTNARKGMALLLAHMGRMDEARLQFAQGLGVSADSSDAYAALGDSLLMNDDFDPAIVCYREILKRDPNLAAGHNSLGFALSKKGRLDEAVAQYREAVRLKPDYKQAHFNLGITLLQKGDIDGAIAQMTETLKIAPDAVDIHHNLGLALLRKGRKQEAVAQLQEALRLQPGFEPSRRVLDELGRSR